MLQRSLAFSFSLLVSIALPLQPTVAVERVCIESRLSDALGGSFGEGHEIDFKAYEQASSILFLSDGYGRNDFQLATAVARRFPEKRIVQTDYYRSGSRTEGNLTQMHLDNTKPFPFRDNEFDMIVMRKGLCICHGTHATCGGFCPIGSEAKRFFTEVARGLNKRKTTSVAILHGAFGVTSVVERHWWAFFEEIEKGHGVRITVQAGPSGEFNSVRITPHH